MIFPIDLPRLHEARGDVGSSTTAAGLAVAGSGASHGAGDGALAR